MRCSAVQERLADEGAALIQRDAALREHVAGCSDCGSFLEALEQVDASLSRLPAVPAPPSLLARTAKAVNGESKPAPGNRRADPGARKLATALAAMVILAAGFGLVESVQQELQRMERLYPERFPAPSGQSLIDRLTNPGRQRWSLRRLPHGRRKRSR